MCSGVGRISHVADGIIKKWWRQHISDDDGCATRAPGLKLRDESLGLTMSLLYLAMAMSVRHYLVESIDRIRLDWFFMVKT